VRPPSPEHLAGLLGHELRNPLAAAVTGALLLREMTDQDDPRAQVLDGVLRDLDRVTELTNGWLQLARGARVGRARVGVADLVRAVAARHRADVVVCPDDGEVEGNRALLERALDNLCENSRQAGARTIRIAVQCLGDGIAFHVEDDGSGVAAADVDRIFSAGWSARGSAGLGLHGVATTVAAHGGTVRCVPLARGTRFTVVLPNAHARTVTA
jgi:signal transduction histidine kinase